MLKDILDRYKISNENADETATDEIEDTSEEETTEEVVKETDDESVDEVEDTEADGSTTVLEAPTDEQGEVSVADTEEVVAEVTPSEDVTEAGDDIGQATPTEAFDDISDEEDITEGSDELAAPTDTGEAEDAAAVNGVVTDGEEVARGQEEIIQAAEQAAGEIEGGGADTDVNGNAITEGEAEANAEEEAIDKKIDEETAAADTTKGLTDEETPLEAAEAEADELADEEEESLDGGTDDEFGGDADSGGSELGGTEESGEIDDPFGGDSTTVDTESTDDSLETDGTDTNLEETETEVSEEDTNTEATQGAIADVDEAVDDQNAAAAVTAEGASSEVGDLEEIEGKELAEDDAAIPVDVTDTFKDKEVDGNPTTSDNHQDDSAATVEETIDEPEAGIAEDIAVGAEEDNDELAESVAEDEVGGEIDETEEPADFEEGELDIPDVDEETTDEDVAVSEVEADDEEVLADHDEQLAEDANKTVEELQQEAKGLEAFAKRLQYGIESGNYNPTLVADIYVKLSSYGNVFGPTVNRIALEEYGPGDMDLAYTASLESIRGYISRIVLTAGALDKKMTKWFERPLTTKVTTRANAINKASDKTLVDLKSSGYTGGEVTGVSGYLSTNDDGLVRAVANDLKYTTGIAVKGMDANERVISTISRVLDDIIAAKTPEAVNSILKRSTGIKSAKESYPNEVFTKGKMMGNWKLTMKDGAFGVSAIPVPVKETSGDRHTSFKLTKADLSSLLLMAKTYTALATKLADTVGDKVIDDMSAIKKQRSRALPIGGASRVTATEVDEKRIDELCTDLGKIAAAHRDMYQFVTKHALDMADAINAVVKKAI